MTTPALSAPLGPDRPAGGPPSALRARQRLALAGFVSLGLHALLLIGWQSTAGSRALGEFVAPRDQPVLQVQLLAAATSRDDPTVKPSQAVAAAASPALPPVPVVRPDARSVPAPASTPSPTRPENSAAATTASGSPQYREDGLDPPPRPLTDIELTYPPGTDHMEGTVVLRLRIDEAGRLDDVSVVRATLPGVFDAAAIAAFRAVRYAPGVYQGKPVKSQLLIAVDYTPTNRGSAVSGAR